MNRTRAGWTTEHQCGCVTSVLGDGEDAVQTVSYCPKHKAAPEMYEALKLALDETPGQPLGEDVKAAMRQALAKASGSWQKTILTESRPGGIVTKITEWRPEGRAQ